MRVRIRGPSGTSTATLEDDATVGDLYARIKENTGLTSFDIKYGYPPKPLLLESKSALLSGLDIKLNGEQLTVSAKSGSIDSPQSKSDTSFQTLPPQDAPTFSFANTTAAPPPAAAAPATELSQPIELKHKAIEGEVPEIPMPDRGATLGQFCPLQYLS
jgi:ubiquitin thioesterase OTU1